MGSSGMPATETGTGVGVLDKCVAILSAVRFGSASVAELTAATGLPRATVHRLVGALEQHGLLRRSGGANLSIGPLPLWLASVGAGEVMVSSAQPFLIELRDATGETAQLFLARGRLRLCSAAAERGAGLRDSVGAGDVLPMTAGSAAQVLLAWEAHPDDDIMAQAKFSAAELAAVRRRGWAQSVGQREAGLASVSAPVRYGDAVIGAVCVSGPVQRLGQHPGKLLAPVVTRVAAELSSHVAAMLGRDDGSQGWS